MFELNLTREQVKEAAGFVTVWETDDGISRVSLEAENPTDTDFEFVAKASPLVKFGALHFGGVGDNGVKVTFDQSGVVRNVEAI